MINMYGGVFGDLAGSTHEYNQHQQISRINEEQLIKENSFYSDDTILTIAILDAYLNDKNYEYYLKEYANTYMDYKPNFTPYFKNAFSPNFIKWVKGKVPGNSTGNGAMMRISPIGYLCETEQELRENVKKATIPSHNSIEAIECAEIVVMIIFLSRKGYTKEEIINKLNLKYSYIPFKKFNTTCYETINNCLYALFTSNGFKESIRTVISYGGDTDTNACIVGSMAEAMYGIDDEIIEQSKQKLPLCFIEKLDNGYSLIKKYHP